MQREKLNSRIKFQNLPSLYLASLPQTKNTLSVQSSKSMYFDITFIEIYAKIRASWQDTKLDKRFTDKNSYLYSSSHFICAIVFVKLLSNFGSLCPVLHDAWIFAYISIQVIIEYTDFCNFTDSVILVLVNLSKLNRWVQKYV